jgi:hypothetical protein
MAPTPRPARFLALVAPLALALVACGGGGTVSRVRVPIAESPVGPAKAEQCVATCRAHHATDVGAYGACLAECPGAEIEYGQRCRALRGGPRAACAEMALRRPGPEGPALANPDYNSSGNDAGGAFLVGLFGAVVEGAVEGAAKSVAGGKRESGSQPASTSGEGAQAAPTAPPAREAAPPPRVAAAPSKEHAKASPSRDTSSSGKGKEKKPRVD